jgi:hypothetical protein
MLAWTAVDEMAWACAAAGCGGRPGAPIEVVAAPALAGEGTAETGGAAAAGAAELALAAAAAAAAEGGGGSPP